MLLTQKQIGGKCQWSRHLPVKKIVHLEKRVDFYLKPLKKKKKKKHFCQLKTPTATLHHQRYKKQKKVGYSVSFK